MLNSDPDWVTAVRRWTDQGYLWVAQVWSKQGGASTTRPCYVDISGVSAQPTIHQAIRLGRQALGLPD